jgi:hypothetical protein
MAANANRWVAAIFQGKYKINKDVSNCRYRIRRDRELGHENSLLRRVLMLTSRRKMIIGICLLLGIVLPILGCGGMKLLVPQKQRYPQDATRVVDITIDISQREEFFDQLRKFADKHDFTILIDAQPSGDEDFLIYMTREDVEIIGDNAFTPGEYGFGFYHADLLHPVSELAFDDLIGDLKSFISEVPDATFSIKK